MSRLVWGFGLFVTSLGVLFYLFIYFIYFFFLSLSLEFGDVTYRVFNVLAGWWNWFGKCLSAVRNFAPLFYDLAGAEFLYF